MQAFRDLIGSKKRIIRKGGWNHRPLRWLTLAYVDSIGKRRVRVLPVFGTEDSH